MDAGWAALRDALSLGTASLTEKPEMNASSTEAFIKTHGTEFYLSSFLA